MADLDELTERLERVAAELDRRARAGEAAPGQTELL